MEPEGRHLSPPLTEMACLGVRPLGHGRFDATCRHLCLARISHEGAADDAVLGVPASGELTESVERWGVDERSRRIAKRFEVPMVIAALLVIPVIAIEQSDVAEPWRMITGVLNWAISRPGVRLRRRSSHFRFFTHSGGFNPIAVAYWSTVKRHAARA